MQASRYSRSALVAIVCAAAVFETSRLGVIYSQGEPQHASPIQTFTVTTTAGSGAGSLRQAILDANASGGTDTINFNIPGGGIQSILNTTAFATISDPVIIDATTQPGYAGTPLIELDASSSSTTAFNITAGGSTIKGFRFANYGGAATNFVVTLGGGNNVLTACTFGVGDSIRSSTAILIDGSNNNRVGGSTPSERNYIAQNRRVLIRNGATGNRVIGSWFGADTNGAPLMRTVGYGVRIENASGNFVGGAFGTTPGGACTGECNSIAGANNGVEIAGSTSTNNKVSGNIIGLLADGVTINANAGHGVRITDAPNNIVGGTTAAERNVITGSPQGGVRIENATATSNVVSGNYIGVKTDGSSTGGSTTVTQGVTLINGVTNTRIGGVTAGERNVISGNNSSGVSISNGSNNNLIQGNFIGTDATGTQRSTTRGSGVSITNSNNNTIGGTQGTTAGGPCTGACNLISGNGVDGSSSGIFLFASGGGTTSGNLIDGNYIGLNAAGNATILNGRTPDGTLFNGRAIQLANASNNIIGRPASAGLNPGAKEQNLTPAAVRCVQDDETGDYVRWLSPNASSTSPNDLVDYEAKSCLRGITYTGLGPMTSIPPDTVFDGLSEILEVNSGNDFRIVGCYTATLFRDSVGMIQTTELTSHIQDNVPSDSTCECPNKGTQTVAGTVEATGQGDDSDNNYFGYQLFGQTAQGIELDLALPEAPLLINFGNGNRIESVLISSLDEPPIEIRDGDDNSYWQVDVRKLQDELSIEIGAAAEQIPKPTNVTIEEQPDGRFRIAASMVGGPSEAEISAELATRNYYLKRQLEAISEHLFTECCDVRLDFVTDAAGNGTVVFQLSSLQSAFLRGQNGFGLVFTEIIGDQGTRDRFPEGSIFGASSPVSDFVAVPGATVSGRITRPGGSGLRGAVVSIEDTVTGYRRTASTSTFGFYAFEGVTRDHRYTVSVASRRYHFLPRTELITANLPNVNFLGQE